VECKESVQGTFAHDISSILWKYRRADGPEVAPNQHNIHFSMERGMRIMNWVLFFLHMRIVSAVKRVEFVSDRMSYIILRGRWYDIIVLNIHAPTKGKIDDVKDSFYKEQKHVFDKFLK
jgi:hypothetical protein